MANPRFHQLSPSSAAAMMPVNGGAGKAACTGNRLLEKAVRQRDIKME
jgi:hypothetical protein